MGENPKLIIIFFTPIKGFMYESNIYNKCSFLTSAYRFLSVNCSKWLATDTHTFERTPVRTPELLPVCVRVCCARFNFKRIPVLVVVVVVAGCTDSENSSQSEQGKSISLLLLPKVSVCFRYPTLPYLTFFLLSDYLDSTTKDNNDYDHLLLLLATWPGENPFL